MAYKHLIQEELPYVTYALDEKPSNNQFSAYSLYTNATASYGYVSATGIPPALKIYPVPIVYGNNISVSFPFTTGIRTIGNKIFTEKNLDKEATIEFWARFPATSPTYLPASTEIQIVVPENNKNKDKPSGLFISGQHLIFRYGDSFLNDSQTSNSYVECSLPIDKINKPMHIALIFSQNQITLYCNGVINTATTKVNNENIVKLNDYNANLDYLYFGGGTDDIEISCISLYDYALPPSDLYKHYIFAQQGNIPSKFYLDLSAYPYQMSLRNEDIKIYKSKNKNISINYPSDWQSLQTAGVFSLSSGLSVEENFGSVFISKQGKNFNTDWIKTVNNFSETKQITASGIPVYLGKYLESQPLSGFPLNGTSDFWIESSVYLKGVLGVGDQHQILYIDNPENDGYISIYAGRSSTTTASVKLKFFGSATEYSIANALGYGNTDILKIGIIKTTSSIVYYGVKNDNTTLSGSIDISSIQEIKSLPQTTKIRFGATNSWDQNTALANIDQNNSSSMYVNYIKIGEKSAYNDTSGSARYHNIQFSNTLKRMMYGVYNEILSFDKIPFTEIYTKNQITGIYSLFRNRLDFAFLEQTDDANKNNNIQIYKKIYSGNTLSSSSRILSSSQTILYPASAVAESAISSSTIAFDVLFSTNDVILKSPELSYFNFYGLNSSSINPNSDGTKISLIHSNTPLPLGQDNISLPQYKTTAFINNPVQDSGLLIGSTGNYANIPISFSNTSSVYGISFYIYIPKTSVSSSIIARLTGTTINYSISFYGNNGITASIGYPTATFSNFYINSSSVSVSAGVASVNVGQWNSIFLKFNNPITAGENSTAIIRFGKDPNTGPYDTTYPFFIDELVFYGKNFTEDSMKKIYNIQTSGVASTTYSIKDGASPTIDLFNTFGSTSSSKVSFAIMDKEIDAVGSIANSQKIQLFTKEAQENYSINSSSIISVVALKTGSVTVDEYNPAYSFIDNVRISHGDKILVNDGRSFLQTASFISQSGLVGDWSIAIDMPNNETKELFNSLLTTHANNPSIKYTISIPSVPAINKFGWQYRGRYHTLLDLVNQYNNYTYINLSLENDQNIQAYLNASFSGGQTVLIQSGTASTTAIYTASVDFQGIKLTNKQLVNDKNVFYIQNGKQYGKIYCAFDKFNGELKLNIFEDRYKVKHSKKTR